MVTVIIIAPKGLLCRRVQKLMFVCPSVTDSVSNEIDRSQESGPKMCALAKECRSLRIPKLTPPGPGGKMRVF